MRMPRRADFGENTKSFLAAMDGWIAASESAYQHLRSIYDATEPVTTKPQWLIDFTQVDRSSDVTIKHVDCVVSAINEDSIEAALNNLSGSALDSGLTIVRVCHGEMNPGFWSCYAEMTKA